MLNLDLGIQRILGPSRQDFATGISRKLLDGLELRKARINGVIERLRTTYHAVSPGTSRKRKIESSFILMSDCDIRP